MCEIVKARRWAGVIGRHIAFLPGNYTDYRNLSEPGAGRSCAMLRAGSVDHVAVNSQDFCEVVRNVEGSPSASHRLQRQCHRGLTRAHLQEHQGSACMHLKGMAARCEFCLRKNLAAGDVDGSYKRRSRQIQVHGLSHSPKGWSRWLDQM